MIRYQNQFRQYKYSNHQKMERNLENISNPGGRNHSNLVLKLGNNKISKIKDIEIQCKL